MSNNSNSTTKASAAGAKQRNLKPLEFLEELHQRQLEWNDKHYKSTTEKLYGLLADCLEAYNQLNAAELGVRKRFFALCEEHCEIEASKKMHLTARIVSYVFRITGPRARAYSRVLKPAVGEKVPSNVLPKWIEDRGGIEAIRRANENGKPSTEKEKAAQAASILEAADALCIIEELPASLHSDSSNSHNFSLALIRHDRIRACGEVVRGSANGSLVDQFLAAVASKVQEEAANRRTASKHSTALAQDAASIAGAVAAAASQRGKRAA